MNKGMTETRTAEHEQRIAEIRTRIEARRTAHEQRLNAVRARIEARKAKRNHPKAMKPAAKAEPNAELQATKAALMAGLPTIHFPEDDPKYNSALKHDCG